MLKVLTPIMAFLLMSASAQAAPSKLQKCLGNISSRIALENFEKCESFTRLRNLKPREKAQLFLQLGITVQAEQKKRGSKAFRDKPTLPLEYWEKAIAADKTYAETYLIMATTYGYQRKAELKRQVLELGRSASPDDPRFDSEIALIEATPETGATVREFCDRATSHPSADQSVFYNCGEAFWRSGLKTEAQTAFERAALGYPVEQTSRYGLIQSSIDATTFASHLSEEGRNEEAAEFFEKYVGLKDPNNVDLTELELIGDLYLKARKPIEAAAVFEKAARQTKDDMQHKFKLRQIVSLAAGGNGNEAVSLSTGLYERASKKQILQMQLKLKNGLEKQLIITGKFDEDTKSALANCILDPGCFGNTPGQPI